MKIKTAINEIEHKKTVGHFNKPKLCFSEKSQQNTQMLFNQEIRGKSQMYKTRNDKEHITIDSEEILKSIRQSLCTSQCK